MHTPMAWAKIVAQPAPAMPMAGTGPAPKMKIGSSTALNSREMPRISMGERVSPLPRKMASTPYHRVIQGKPYRMGVR